MFINKKRDKFIERLFKTRFLSLDLFMFIKTDAKGVKVVRLLSQTEF